MGKGIRAKIKKPNKSNAPRDKLMEGIQELTKGIMFLYLRDVKKFDYDELLTINKFFARQVMSISKGLITFDDIFNELLEKGIDLTEIGKETDEYIDKYWGVYKK